MLRTALKRRSERRAPRPQAHSSRAELTAPQRIQLAKPCPARDRAMRAEFILAFLTHDSRCPLASTTTHPQYHVPVETSVRVDKDQPLRRGSHSGTSIFRLWLVGRIARSLRGASWPPAPTTARGRTILPPLLPLFGGKDLGDLLVGVAANSLHPSPRFTLS